jgi:small subunit ribosomal protein S7
MPRRKRAPKRTILPDPLFRSALLAKFINSIMREGKKSLAERIVYGALDDVVKKLQASGKAFQKVEQDDSGEGGTTTTQKPLSGDIRSDAEVRAFVLGAFKKALDNVTPSVEVKSRRVGGSTYQVPVEVRSTRRMALAMRWLVEYASKRNEKTMVGRLANEIMDALDGRGGAVKKREDTHRMAKANQAFAHFRW